MSVKITCKPYKEMPFRNPLEAQWAVFFDMLDWPWDYQASERGDYAPDFRLNFSGGTILVKVQSEISTSVLNKQATKFYENGCWTGETLLLGSVPYLLSINGYELVFGHLVEIVSSDDSQGVRVAVSDAKVFRCGGCGRMSLHGTHESWHCRYSGCDGGFIHANWPPACWLREGWEIAYSVVHNPCENCSLASGIGT